MLVEDTRSVDARNSQQIFTVQGTKPIQWTGRAQKTCTPFAYLSNALLAISTELDCCCWWCCCRRRRGRYCCCGWRCHCCCSCCVFLCIVFCYILLWLSISWKHGPKDLCCCSPPDIRDESCGKFHSWYNRNHGLQLGDARGWCSECFGINVSNHFTAGGQYRFPGRAWKVTGKSNTEWGKGQAAGRSFLSIELLDTELDGMQKQLDRPGCIVTQTCRGHLSSIGFHVRSRAFVLIEFRLVETSNVSMFLFVSKPSASLSLCCKYMCIYW